MTDWEPKITTFLCNWCSYGAADLAGVSRFQYPPQFQDYPFALLRQGEPQVYPGCLPSRL